MVQAIFRNWWKGCHAPKCQLRYSSFLKNPLSLINLFFSIFAQAFPSPPWIKWPKFTQCIHLFLDWSNEPSWIPCKTVSWTEWKDKLNLADEHECWKNNIYCSTPWYFSFQKQWSLLTNFDHDKSVQSRADRLKIILEINWIKLHGF